MANIFDEIDPRGGSRQSANAATDNSASASSNIFDQIDPRGGAPAKAKQPAAADNRDTGSFPRRPVMQLGQEDASGHRFAETTTEYNTPDDASQERGIVQRTREGAAAPMEGEHGFSQESLQKYPWLSWLQPRAQTLDVAARTPSSILGGLAGAGAGVVEKLPTWLGGGPSQADRMQRDLTAAPNALAGLVPEAPAGFPRPLAREVAANVPKPPTPPPLPREPPTPVARQVQRPGVGVDLLPTETPHTLPPQRPALSAAGIGGPLSDVSPETIAHMRAVMEEQGFNQHTIDQRLSELSAHHFLGEITPSLEADMGAVALPPGPGKLEVMGSIRQRALEARERTQHEFDRAFGVNENIPQLTKIIEGDRARAAGPLYRKFRETEITPTPEIDALMPRLEAAGALRAANRDLAVEGEPATHGFADPQNPDSTRRVPTAGAFQAVAEHLGDKIKAALAEEGGMGEARRLTGLRNALLKALDEHPQVGDTWRQARAAYAQPSQVLNAVRMGQKALSNRVLADDLPFLTSSFSEPEMRGLRIGMRGHLEQMLGKKDTLTAETINTVLSPNNVQKLRWAIGDAAADQLVAAMEHERHMHTAPTRIHGGSPTAARIEANKRWSVQPKDEGMTLGDVGGYIRHPIRSITGAGLEAADRFGVRHRRAANETRMARLREEASHIFTLQGPQRDAVARYLVEGEPHQLDPITVTAPPRKRGGAVHGDPRERALRTVQRRFGGRIGYAEGGDTGRAFPSMLNAMETSAQDSLIHEGLDPGVGGLRGVQGIGSFAPVAFPKSVDEPRPSRGKSYFKGETKDPNAGVDAPVNAKIQTVADPHRMMYPGIYRNPREIAEEAAARVGPEDISMKRLFGVSRGDLREMAQGRVGNEEPKVNLVANPRGSVSAQNIQTPQNTKRLTDILEEAGKHEGLRTADAWYIMDPAFKRMQELFGGEAAKRYSHLNTMTGMASPGSNVNAEIARGTAAHWLEQQGRFQDFQKFAGIPENLRAVMPSFPPDMRRIPGHPYHRTSQGDPMEKYLDTGAIQSEKAKVPLYVHASGVPETGFQTTGPVGDAHFSRGVGLADTRKGPSNVKGSFQRPEYQTLQPWWQRDVASKVGLESVPAQARLWTALGPQTGVESALGAPKLELLSAQIMRAAHRLGVSPEKARDMVLSGHAGAFLRGGGVPHMADGGEPDDDGAMSSETFVPSGLRNWARQAAPKDVDIIRKAVDTARTLPKRSFEASDRLRQSFEAGEPGDPQDAGVMLEAAALPMGTGAMARMGYGAARGAIRDAAAAGPEAKAGLDVSPGVGGPSGGAEGVREAQLQAQRRAGPHQPLPGLPLGAQVVEGKPFYPGPVAAAHDVAQAYMKDKDFGLPIPDRYHPVDVEHSRAIAKAFEDMPHAPNDPQVKAAYDALAKETLDQYRAIKATGLKITPVNAADYPYHGNPRAVVKDVADNNHMAFFKSREGFGNEEADLTHPLMRSSGEKVGDHDMLYNDLFRVVHDYFGHIKNGFGFRGAGEDNAFRAHAPMYSPLARRAMATETRGQNSWLNYGPHGDFNRTANAADTIYADQKVGLMPEWTMSDRQARVPKPFDDLPAETKTDVAHALMERVPALDKYARGRPEDVQALLDGAVPTLNVGHHTVDPKAIDISSRSVSPRAVEKYANMNTEPPPVVMSGNDLIEGGHRIAAGQKTGRQVPAVDVSDLLKMDWEDWLSGGTGIKKAEGGAVDLSTPADHLRTANVAPPEPRGYNAPLPNISYESQRYYGHPRLSGGLNVPVGGGELNLGGSYQTREDAAPNWSARLGYTRRFARGGVVSATLRAHHRRGGRAFADGGAPTEDDDQAAMMPETFANPAVRSMIDHAAAIPRRAFEASEAHRRGEGYDPGPILEAATLPMGTGAIAGLPVRAGEAVLGSGVVRGVKSGMVKEYPIAPRGEWYGDANYEATGGRMSSMTPDEFLAQARPMKIDEVARENIDDLKAHMQSGKTLDPLALYKNGKEDGRHRAIAAKELGIKDVPVLNWREPGSPYTKGGLVSSTLRAHRSRNA